jgi:hypothetical protein
VLQWQEDVFSGKRPRKKKKKEGGKGKSAEKIKGR